MNLRLTLRFVLFFLCEQRDLHRFAVKFARLVLRKKISFLQTLSRFGSLSRRVRANMRSNAYLPIRPVQVPSYTKNGSGKTFRSFPNHWCEQRDLNPHGLPLDPKSSASANSATSAYETMYSIRFQ